MDVEPSTGIMEKFGRQEVGISLYVGILLAVCIGVHVPEMQISMQDLNFNMPELPALPNIGAKMPEIPSLPDMTDPSDIAQEGYDKAMEGVQDIKESITETLNMMGQVVLEPLERVWNKDKEPEIENKAETDNAEATEQVSNVTVESTIEEIILVEEEQAEDILLKDEAQTETEEVQTDEAQSETEEVQTDEAQTETEELQTDEAQSETEEVQTDEAQSETEEVKTDEAQSETEEVQTDEAQTETEEVQTDEAQTETEEVRTDEAQTESEEVQTDEAQTETEEVQTDEAQTETEEEPTNLTSEETFSAENIQVEEIEIHEKPEVPGLDVLINEEGIPEDGSENTAEIEQDADIITKDPIKIVDDELKNLESELVYEEGNEIDIPSLTITNIEEKEMKKEEGENIEFVEQEEAEEPKILKEINESPLKGDRSLDMKTGG